MGAFTVLDGLILTLVAILVVFIVLAAIWGLVELNAKIIAYFKKEEAESGASVVRPEARNSAHLTADPEHKKVAEIMALILASEDKPDRKFEIVESKRVK